MNEKDYVTYEISELLKEKGFNEFCGYTYIEDKNNIGITNTTNSKLPKGVYSMPTLYQAQKWLRERHNCYVQITYEAYKGRFVDRKEGYKIALEAGQINEENRAFPNIKLLCSEDLY